MSRLSQAARQCTQIKNAEAIWLIPPLSGPVEFDSKSHDFPGSVHILCINLLMYVTVYGMQQSIQ